MANKTNRNTDNSDAQYASVFISVCFVHGKFYVHSSRRGECYNIRSAYLTKLQTINSDKRFDSKNLGTYRRCLNEKLVSKKMCIYRLDSG